ncbi:hypothetical protein [Agrobacterium sp. FDAARGOS_525]|uniref:hypothetical protein n=1 Tax=Agrobacterium sp. FDAARGOS_525 TaxID=2420311 RepID=UPI00256E9E02|nr:hypothetical protein [Agrobacterium sp. FDAARGOS_525]
MKRYIFLRSVIFVFFLSLSAGEWWGLAAHAADVAVVNWRGHQVLKLSGEIDEGTERKLAALLKQVSALPHGLPVLLLDSPGGFVDEALLISSLLDQVSVHTVIPKGARCASACASIIFVAGRARTVEDGGLLGQHSCSRGGVPDDACNEALSKHAVEHGVSHGSIGAFVTYVPPEKILWFSREDAEGWGLTKYPGEDLSGFEKSEPRVIKLLTGKTPQAQSAWRINFREDGFEAFVRTASDFEREMQLNVFCSEKLPGKLFLGMEVNGPAEAVRDAVVGLAVEADRASWEDVSPLIHQKDEQISEVVTEVPREHLKAFLTKADKLTFGVALKHPYQPMIAQTWLGTSRKVLLFAANNCMGTTTK